jgi:hypothetical protein
MFISQPTSPFATAPFGAKRVSLLKELVKIKIAQALLISRLMELSLRLLLSIA